MAVVSIMLPTYNRADYLKQAIESIRSQTFRDWELIIVNDGSTDTTPQVLDEYVKMDSRIQAIHQLQSGLSKARNQALKSSRSEYVAFIDDDDLWLPQKLEKQLNYFNANPHIGMLFSQAKMTDNDLNELDIYPKHWSSCTFEALLKRDYWIPMSSVILRRICTDRIGYFDENLARSMDHDYWLRLALEFAFDGLREPLALYRQHSGMVSSAMVGMYQDHLKIYLKLLKVPQLKKITGLIKSRIARTHYELGREYRKMKDFPSAAKHFLKAVRYCPWIGFDFARYHSRSIWIFLPLKPYLAAFYCRLSTIFFRKKTVQGVK